MDKTGRTELHRTFVIEGLPAPLTRASAHIQLFDNYISKTRMRLRSIRVPESREWTRILQKRNFPNGNERYKVKFSEIYLDEGEHERFEIFAGDEIRKNRYFHEFDGRSFAFDVYLGKLWGLNIARVEFSTDEELMDFAPPLFALLEVTNEPFFIGETLVHHTFANIPAEVERLRNNALPIRSLGK